jgi:hypothetical protein
MAAVALAALGVVVVTAGPANAQVSCTGVQTASPATVSTSSLLPGESITITGSGFANTTYLGIGLFNPPVVLGSVASNPNGNYTATVQIPVGTPAGQNEITVFGQGPNATCHQSLALFTVRQPPTPVTVTSVVTVFVPTPFVQTPQQTIIVTSPTTAATPIVVQQPLARTGSPSMALVAAGLLFMLLGVHVLRAAGRRPITG